MRKIIFYGAVSLDGFLAGRNEELDWLLTTDLGGKSSYDVFIETIDTVVMGRITYQEALKLNEDAPLYPQQEVVVFSRQQESINGQTTIHEDPVKYLKQLKKRAGKNIWIVGGGDLLRPILEANLIDEWFIQIAPVFLGDGKRFFAEHSLETRL